jgi:hypothetical protein
MRRRSQEPRKTRRSSKQPKEQPKVVSGRSAQQRRSTTTRELPDEIADRLTRLAHDLAAATATLKEAKQQAQAARERIAIANAGGRANPTAKLAAKHER